MLAVIVAIVIAGASYTPDQIADAIYVAEGGARAKKPYGILSVPCDSQSSCRAVCLNTIRNNLKRWERAGRPGEYIDFLASRYAPPTAHPLNRNWKPNVVKILKEMSHGRTKTGDADVR